MNRYVLCVLTLSFGFSSAQVEPPIAILTGVPLDLDSFEPLDEASVDPSAPAHSEADERIASAVAVQNNTEGPLTLSYHRRDDTEPSETKDRQTDVVEIPAHDARVFLVSFPETILNDETPGHLVIQARDAAGPVGVLVHPLENDPPPEPAVPDVVILGIRFSPLLLAPVFAVLTVLASWAFTRPSAGRWLVAESGWDFTKSWGSVTSIVLAAVNTSLIEQFSPLAAETTEPQQILGVLFALPLFFAPVIFRAFTKPLDEQERQGYPLTGKSLEKAPVLVYGVASALILTSVLLELAVLYSWLSDLVFAGLPQGFGAGLPLGVSVFAVMVVLVLAFMTVRKTILEEVKRKAAMPGPTAPPTPDDLLATVKLQAEQAGESEPSAATTSVSQVNLAVDQLRQMIQAAETTTPKRWSLL